MGLSEATEVSLLLDEKLLCFMDRLELLEEKRRRLNTVVEQGWFSMSKARYSMGNKQVSALQYASEMDPLVRVHTRTLENGETEFNTERITHKSPEKFSRDVLPVEDIGPYDDGLRRRTKSKKDPSHGESSDEKRELSTTKSVAPEGAPDVKGHQSPQQDPLKWFGILVPQSLKQAQSSFKQVIELSAEIAAIQSAIIKTRKELVLEMKLKHLPQDATSAEQPEKATH